MKYKRHVVVKKLLSVLKENDVAIFTGEELCEEAFAYDRPGNFYIKNVDGFASSIALGMALCNDKRIFVFCEDWDFLKEAGVAAQMGVSRAENIFYILLSSGRYSFSGGQPNIFAEVTAPKWIFSGFGFITNDFTHYLKNKKLMKELESYIERVRGPLIVLMNIKDEFDKNARVKIKQSPSKLVKRIKKFLVDSNLGTSLYTPPFIGGR
jgi:hypothetical protein